MLDTQQISPVKAQEMVSEGNGVLVDIRSIGEVLTEKLPGSLFLPFDLVSGERLKEVGGAQKTPILVCRSGTRAKQAAEALVKDIPGVAVLEGGMNSWRESGLPVDKGRKTIPLDRQVLVAAGSMILLFTLLGLLVSSAFFYIPLFMSGGMIFAGLTGSCGMARILMLFPWNKRPLCEGSCAPEEKFA